MSYHGAMSDLALQNMTAARRRDLQNAARLLAGAADLSTERLARLLGEAQGGAPFAPDFEADLLVIATADATPRRARIEHAEHLAGLIAAGGPVGALAAYLRDADLPRAAGAGALLRRHATRIEAPQ